MVIKQNYIRDLLFILFMVYFAQGSLYASGSIISQTVLFVILGISAFYFFKTLILKNNKNLFYNVWTVFLVLNVIGFVFTANYTDSKHFGMFKKILIFSLPFYPFYYFAMCGLLKSKHLIRFFIVMLPITIIQYYFSASRVMLETSDDANIVNNVAYSFVGLLPFVFLFKKKLLSFATMFVLIFFIIQGAKRGAMLSGALGLLVFIYYQMRTVEKNKRWRGYLFAFIAIFLLSYYAYDVYQSNEYLITRMERLTEGDSSGRDSIYVNVFNGWYNSDSFIHLLFGFGFAASIKFAGNFAHNDWLELLSNFGLLGIVVYSVLFYAAIKYVIYKKWSIDKRLLMFTIVSIWFFMTIVSMGYTSRSGYIQAILIAYLIGSRSSKIE